jgi:hypothetical protein
MKLGLTAAAVLLALGSNTAYSQEYPYSGNVLYDSCKDISTGFITNSSAHARGLCGGIIHAVYRVQNYFNFCAPSAATVQQGAKIAVKYMDDNPHELHEDLTALAVRSFVQAWPCKR